MLGTGSRLVSSNSLLVQNRSVSQVVAHRFTGVMASKVGPPKTDWYRRVTSEFLKERNRRPVGYVQGFTGEDLSMLSPQMRSMYSLRMASGRDVHLFRKHAVAAKYRTSLTDKKSLPVYLATLSERILNIRRHILERPKDKPVWERLQIFLSRRVRAMRKLYKTDYETYLRICRELQLTPIRFSVPFKRARESMLNVAENSIDGDRCKWLIRQKLWKGKFRPRPVTLESGQLVRFTRHPLTADVVDKSKDKLPTTLPGRAVNSSWPMGARQAVIDGRTSHPNPSAPGKGYTTCPIYF